MADQKHILLTFAVAVPVPDEPFEDFGERDKIANRIEEAIAQSLGDIPNNCGVISTRFTELDSDYVNCGQCWKCGAWTTDNEKEKPLAGLSPGASVEDVLFCDLCLPVDHAWAF